MGFYNRVTGNRDQHEIAPPRGGSSKPEPFNPIELEQAFGGAYRSYRVNRRPKMDVETFFNRIGGTLIDLIAGELKTRNSAKIQMTAWIRFAKGPMDPATAGWSEASGDQDRIDQAFNSLMTRVHRGNDFDKIVNEVFSHMETRIENPALLNGRFVFDEVLYLDVNFHQLNLMRGSSCLPLPKFIVNKKVVINPQNRDGECFKWANIAVENIGMKDP